MFVVGIALVMAVSACSTPSTAPDVIDYAIVVTSPNSNVFLGGSEQMTATASDGRALAGTWGSDNPSAVTVNAATGLAAAVSAGQANVFCIADGRQGAKLIRALPNFAGTFAGKYLVTSCAATGEMAAANVCSTAPPGTLVALHVHLRADWSGPHGTCARPGHGRGAGLRRYDWSGRGCQRRVAQ